MLKRLFLDNCFTHHNKTFEFNEGLTGIVGKNESGKSLIVEMIRYALFGSAALRGKGPDYKKLHVELDFEVLGQTYRSVRKGSQASLELAGAVIASGTKPVNDAIITLLGYDLKVFDVANACNQGNVEALSNMTPTERKQMVDKTVGLTVLDDVIKYCGDEGNARRREAAAFQSALTEPVEPVKPEGFVPSQDIETDLKAANLELAEFNTLKGFLSANPQKPTKPAKCEIAEEVAELVAYQQGRDDQVNLLASLKRQLGQIQAPLFDASILDAAETQHALADMWVEKQKLLARGHHECPKCKHQWAIASEQLEEYADVEETNPPKLSRAQIRGHRANLGNDVRIAELEKQISEVVIPDDRAGDLARRRASDAEHAQYKAALEAYKRHNEGLAEKQSRFAELEGIAETVAKLRADQQVSQIYENQLVQYERQRSHYESNLDSYTKMMAEADHYLNARETIRELKVRVKSLLLPSLNKVASSLLAQMTGGERYQVVVDDDFNIEIDGQPLSTLSGSGKAVANLSIRIALGQILTNRVFSVFMGDEVDAAMDDERAMNTAAALRRLTDAVAQVVIVTHKKPETDHLIELTK